MKKALLTLMCLAAMMAAGVGLKAQEVTITLNPGWTWISYPKAEAMDIATALCDFVPMEGDVVKSQFSLSEYHNGNWMGGLTHFIPGLGYMYCSNRSEAVSFVFGGSSSQASVVVTTSEPMLITAISAMGGGEVTTTDGTYIIVKGLCWATHENPTTNEDAFVEEGSGVGSFSATMTGLNISTTYYYRAYAVTANSTVYGEQQTFTTRDGIPTLTTTDITDITGESATSGGNIIDDGGLNVTTRGVCWSTSPNPTVIDSHTTDGSGTSSFTSNMTGLNVSMTYYVRAYATTNAGTAYGNEVSFTTRDGIPTLTTLEVTDIGNSWATCGGNIIDDGGLEIIDRGVCWSTSPNPTVIDSHTTDGNGTGSFTSYITGLSVNSTYYVRAYATNSETTAYGNQLSFTTYYTYVDLGLPSGLLWATCNVGADTPEGFGEFFAWGETQPKNTYNWNTYQHCDGSINTLTKYCNNPDYGYNGFTDTLTILLPEDDAATVNWGSDWRMPTFEEWWELYNTVPSRWTTFNGVYGLLFTASNGNSLFLPAAGSRYDDDELRDWNSSGSYWWSSLYTNEPSTAYFVYFSWNFQNHTNCSRNCGLSIRPVRPGLPNASFIIGATANPAEGGEVNGGGTYQEGAECTLTATANEGYTFSNWTENDEVVSADATYTFTVNADRTLVANFTYNGGNAPTGAINGKFTINDNRDQVYFSQGNLQYQASTETWRFAENQWDYVGDETLGTVYENGVKSDNSLISSTYDGWIDLFCWGTGNNPINEPYGYNLTFSDWGNNPISNGGNIAYQWSTLNDDEWSYIFNSRNTASGIRYAKALVNGVNGVILLPDDWDMTTYSLSNTNSSDGNYNSNTISSIQWTSLENAGAVFLPAAGYRYGTGLSYVGSSGYYWSNHGYYNSYLGNHMYYFVSFNNNGLGTNGYNGPYFGRSVRLVRSAEYR